MGRFGFVLPGLVFLGAAIWSGFFIFQSQALEDDTPGPNLVIEVAGSTSGIIEIDLLPNVAPNHVARIIALAESGAYDGVVFHRVIDQFMAQTGDVQYGRHGGDISRAGAGGSDMPDLEAEFSNIPFQLGTVGMARSMDPNSANSQFFIMLWPEDNLNGKYTVIGRVIYGLETLYSIKLGNKDINGTVTDPDYMARVTIVNK